MPNDKPVLSAYSRASGQEWFFADINKEFIQNIIKVREEVNKQEHVFMQRTKPVTCSHLL